VLFALAISFLASNVHLTMPKVRSQLASTVTTVLRGVDQSSAMCPPLKAGVSAALFIIDFCQELKGNKKGFARIEMLCRWFTDVVAGMQVTGGDASAEMQRSVEDLVQSFNAIRDVAKSSRRRKLFHRAMNKSQDQDDLQTLERDLENALKTFTLNALLNQSTRLDSLSAAITGIQAEGTLRHMEIARLACVSEAEREFMIATTFRLEMLEEKLNVVNVASEGQACTKKWKIILDTAHPIFFFFDATPFGLLKSEIFPECDQIRNTNCNWP